MPKTLTLSTDTRTAHFAAFIRLLLCCLALGILGSCTLPLNRSETTAQRTKSLSPPANLQESELVVQTEDFRTELSSWLRNNARQKYSRIAKEVQKNIDDKGIIFYVDIKDLPARDSAYHYFQMKDGRRLLFNVENASEGPCGQLFVPAAVVDFENGLPVLLTSKGRVTVPNETPGLYFEKTFVRKSEGETPKSIFRPTADWPWNVLPDAQGLIWKYDIRASVQDDWWRRLARRFRDLRDERPFVAVRITDNSLTVESNDRQLIPGQYEQVEPMIEGTLRASYRPRSILVEVSSCK